MTDANEWVYATCEYCWYTYHIDDVWVISEDVLVCPRCWEEVE